MPSGVIPEHPEITSVVIAGMMRNTLGERWTDGNTTVDVACRIEAPRRGFRAGHDRHLENGRAIIGGQDMRVATGQGTP